MFYLSKEHSPAKVTRRSTDGQDLLASRGEEDQVIIPIASRTRRRSHFDVVEVSESLPVKQEPVSDVDNEPVADSLPGPSQVSGKFIHRYVSGVLEPPHFPHSVFFFQMETGILSSGCALDVSLVECLCLVKQDKYVICKSLALETWAFVLMSFFTILHMTLIHYQFLFILFLLY